MPHRTGGPRSGPVVTALAALLALAQLAGCRTYEPAALAPADILRAAEARRRIDPAVGAVELARAVELMRERSPDLLPLQQAVETAGALADMDTPLPNPSLGVGRFLLSGPDVESGARWGVEAVGGWLLDLSGSRAAATGARHAQARVAATDLAATERDAYLTLRRAFTRLTSAHRRCEAVIDVESGARRALDVANRLVEAAQATALDVTELAVDVHLAEADAAAAREAEAEARAELAAITGVAAASWDAVEAPVVPAAPPPRERLVATLLDGHPVLDRLRADHLLAEAELRAEVAAQFAGLGLEPAYEYEEHTDRYGLGLGIEVPLFDRNQLGIARAEGRRDEVRARFEAAVQHQLTAIDAALERLAHRRERLRLLAEEARPAAQRGLELAAGALRSGALDALRFLTVARTERGVRLAVVDAEQHVLEAWCDLEHACGAPLLAFPSVAVSPARRPEENGEDR